MYLSIVSVEDKQFKNIVLEYDDSIKIEKANNHYFVYTKTLEEAVDIYAIVENEYFIKLSSLIIPTTYSHEKQCLDYVELHNDKLLYVEDYIWYCITHNIKSKVTCEVEKIILNMGYDDLFLLYKYIENGANASLTAKTMYIHRNTMDYKLNKWNKVFNLNVKSPKTWMIISFLINKNDLIK